MKILTKISKQTFFQLLGKVVTSLSTFIILGIVARNYGEEGTGVFTLVLAYLAIFYLLSDFGFNAHVLKKITAGPRRGGLQVTDEWQKLLGTRIIWSIILIGLALGLLPFWPFSTKEFSQSVIFGSLAILASGIFVSCNLIFQDRLRYDLSSLASSTGTLIGLGVFIWFTLIGLPVPFLLFAHLTSWIIIALASLFLLCRLTKIIFPVYDIQYTLNLFKDSWPIAATLALNVIYFRADTFMISYFRSNAEVGIYNVAYSIFQSVLVIPSFIMNAYYPLMLKSLSEVKKIASGLVILAVLGTIFTILVSPFLTELITGEGFLGSNQSLQILSLGFPAYFLSSLLMWLFVTKGKYKLMLLIYGTGLIINLGLNFAYIPQYSYFAASYTTVVSEYLILGMQIIALRSILKA